MAKLGVLSFLQDLFGAAGPVYLSDCMSSPLQLHFTQPVLVGWREGRREREGGREGRKGGRERKRERKN